jgi:hypothetical protein
VTLKKHPSLRPVERSVSVKEIHSCNTGLKNLTLKRRSSSVPEHSRVALKNGLHALQNVEGVTEETTFLSFRKRGQEECSFTSILDISGGN